MCAYLYSVPKSDRTTVHKNLIVALGVAELLLMCSDWVSASEVRLNIWHICTCLLKKMEYSQNNCIPLKIKLFLKSQISVVRLTSREKSTSQSENLDD